MNIRRAARTRMGAIAFFIIVPTGCGGFHREPSLEERSALANARIGLLTLVPGRNVRITQSSLILYPATNKVRMVDIRSMWDPGIALESELLQNWKAFVPSEPKPLRSLLNPQDYGLLIGHRERDVLGKSEKDGLGGSIEEAYRSLYVGQLDYLLELTVGKLAVDGGTWRSTTLGTVLYGRLIRLSDGAVLWREKTLKGVRLDGVEKQEDFERDGYAVIRTNFSTLAREIFSPDSEFVSGLKSQ
jgi:hypothetical protein